MHVSRARARIGAVASLGADTLKTPRRKPPDKLPIAGPTLQLLGKLTWLAMQTRPDIAWPVNKCAQMSADPTRANEMWERMVRIVAYVKQTRDRRLTFTAGNNRGWPTLAVFADADFAGCLETRRSTTGVVTTYNGTPIAWSSKRQTLSAAEALSVSSLPALSSGEAELNALTHATRDAIGIRVLLKSLGELPADDTDDWDGPIAIWTPEEIHRFVGLDALADSAGRPTLVCSDSRAAIGTATRPPNRNARHHDLRSHFVRDAIAFRMIQVKHVRTQFQYADALTKAAELDMLTTLSQLMQGQAPMPAAAALYK